MNAIESINVFDYTHIGGSLTREVQTWLDDNKLQSVKDYILLQTNYSSTIMFRNANHAVQFRLSF